MLGLTFALSVLVLPTTPVREEFLKGHLAGAVRWASSYTFSLYLYHAPLLYFWLASFSRLIPDAAPVTHLVVVVFATLLAVVAIGHITEKRKGPYVRFFRRLLSR